MLASSNSIRLVIQRVSSASTGSSTYRIIAYPERTGLHFKPAHFSSRSEVLAKLSEAIPDFDENLIRPDSDSTQVLFAGNLDLTDAQLVKLGLAEK